MREVLINECGRYFNFSDFFNLIWIFSPVRHDCQRARLQFPQYAFPGRNKGEIQIKLHREEKREFIKNRGRVNGSEGSKNEDCKSTGFSLIVSDNGVGISEELNIEDLDSLGMQLVTSLVDQLDGELELKRNNGTEYEMRFTITKKDE